MEVKEASASYLRTTRYKQTEVGVIPEDWVVYTIQELIDRNAITGHLDGNHGELYPRSYEFRESGVPYITANDFSGHKVSFDNCKYLSVERARRFRKGIAKDGDVLFAHNATVGPAALLSTEFEYVILSTTATYFRCNREKLINSFLLYELQSAFFVRQYRAVMAQSTRNQVPITAQRKLSVVLPPTKAEQEVIAEALSDADALIESLAQLLAKKRHLKQGAMQQLLAGKKRLPGFSGEWEVKRLGELSEMGSGGTPSSSNTAYYDGKIPWVSISDMTKCGKFISTTDRNLSSVGLNNSAAQMFPAGTVLYAMYASLGECSIARTSLCSSQAILGIRAKPNLDNEFLYYFLTSIKSQVKMMGQQGTQANLNKGMVQGFQLRLPPRQEQTAIAAILSDMDAELAVLEEKLAKARAIKQGIMQELLTGRIRLI